MKHYAVSAIVVSSGSGEGKQSGKVALRHGRFAKLQIHSAGEKNWLISSEQFVCHESELERDATAFYCLLESTDK